MVTREPGFLASDGRSRSASVEVEIGCEAWAADVDCGRLEALAAAAAGDTPGEIAVRLAGDAEVQGLNQQYRGLDKPTNVLSFPAAPAPVSGAPGPLGDVVLAYETALREANALGVPLADHAAHLIVHGVLHLLGHDHRMESEAEAMEAEERRILARFGIADPYAHLDAAADVAADG